MSGVGLRRPRRRWLLHSGGWKKLEALVVDQLLDEPDPPDGQ